MPLTLGGAGLLGVAFETVYGTYIAPTKWIPIRSESLTHNEEKQVLGPIRGLAVASKVKRGYTIEDGDIEFEVTSDTLLYFLYASRMAITKSVAPAPFTYNFTPVSVVQPTTGAGAALRKTLSIYIERGGEVFAYLGCSVTSLSFTIDNGDLICTAHVMGLTLDTGQAPVASSFPAWNPFGPGTIGIELPSATERIDIDTFSIDINDGGEALNRVKMGSRGPSYVRWGEREVTGSFDHDFLDMTEYNAFNDNTSREMIVVAENDPADDRVQLTLRGLITDSYPINLGGLGDLVRASVSFRSVYNGSPEYEFEILSNESIGV